MIEKTEFARWLQIGLGRAVRYLMEHDVTSYRDVILNACVHHVGFDRQLEGSRAVYLFDIISRTPDFEFYSAALMNELTKFDSVDRRYFRDHDYDIEQIYDLVALLARYGNKQARDLLYRRFEVNPAFGDFIAARAVITMDGLNGFMDIAERLDALVREYGTEYDVGEGGCYDLDCGLLYPLDEVLDKDEFPGWFAKLRQENPALMLLIDTLEQDWNKRNNPPLRPPASLDNPSYDEIYPLLQNPALKQQFIQMRKWGQVASMDDLYRAALDLLQAEDDEIILHYLYIFQKRPFPLEPTRLIQFAQHENEDIVGRALSALKELRHPVVRDFALESIKSNYLPEYTVGLLKHNFEQGDWERINLLTEQDFDAEEMHALGANIYYVFDAHSSVDAVPALLNLYNSNPCSYCREKAVLRLDQLEQIPDWMRAELRYDSNLDIRMGFADMGSSV